MFRAFIKKRLLFSGVRRHCIVAAAVEAVAKQTSASQLFDRRGKERARGLSAAVGMRGYICLVEPPPWAIAATAPKSNLGRDRCELLVEPFDCRSILCERR
jgi:hypothetical protein